MAGTSKYAEKVKAGQQMYGPGCCAHRLTPQRQAAIRARVIEEGGSIPAIPYSPRYNPHQEQNS